MDKKPYCTQNAGDCTTCSLVNYGMDCHNNPVGRGGKGRGQGRKKVVPPDATRRNIWLNDAEYDAAMEVVNKMRRKKDDDSN